MNSLYTSKNKILEKDFICGAYLHDKQIVLAKKLSNFTILFYLKYDNC